VFIACCSESKSKEKEQVNCMCIDGIVAQPTLVGLHPFLLGSSASVMVRARSRSFRRTIKGRLRQSLR